jgi:hypothetical protein
MPLIPGNQWGEDDGDSPEDVLRQQKLGDKIDREYARMAGTPYPDPNHGYQRFVGPICIAPDSMASQLKGEAWLDSFDELVSKSKDVVGHVDDVLNATQEDGSPAAIGAAKEYLENLHNTLETVAKLKRLVSGVHYPFFYIIDQTEVPPLISEAEKNVVRARTISQRYHYNPPGNFVSAPTLIQTGSETYRDGGKVSISNGRIRVDESYDTFIDRFSYDILKVREPHAFSSDGRWTVGLDCEAAEDCYERDDDHPGTVFMPSHYVIFSNETDANNFVATIKRLRQAARTSAKN